MTSAAKFTAIVNASGEVRLLAGLLCLHEGCKSFFLPDYECETSHRVGIV